MISIKINAQAAIKSIKKVAESERKSIKAAIQESARILHNEVVQSASGHRSERVSMGASGQFLQSIQFAPYGDYTWRVFSSAPYAQWVEYGRRPGRAPPPGALDRWVRLKLGVPAEDVPTVSYLIGRKIAEKGIKEKRHFRNSLDRKRKEILKNVKNATKIK